MNSTRALRPDRGPRDAHSMSLGGQRARSIENGLHWVLDVSFREDDSRTRAGHAGANLAMLQRVAVSLLKAAGSKGSIQTLGMRAAWDDDYLLEVIQGISIQ